MDALYHQTLQNMEATLGARVKRVPPPQRVPILGSFAFRYTEKTIHQAIVQKLARIISGLYAARTLLEKGFLQEQAALQRMLDEFQEDVTFLSFAVIFGDVSDLHRRYLDAFFEEEFDKPEDPVASTQKRPMVSRDKIRAYIARVEGSEKRKGVGSHCLTHRRGAGYKRRHAAPTASGHRRARLLCAEPPGRPAASI